MKTFVFTLIFTFSYAQDIVVNKAWNLFGATENLDTSFFTSGCADSVWSYSNGNWKNFAHGTETVTSFTTILKAEGFWVYSYSGNCSLSSSVKTIKSFSTDVYPLLQNMCASCHAVGKTGEASEEWRVESVNSTYSQVKLMLNTSYPENSEFLITPTSVYMHEGGGKRYDVGSPTYNTILDWIKQGAKNN